LKGVGFDLQLCPHKATGKAALDDGRGKGIDSLEKIGRVGGRRVAPVSLALFGTSSRRNIDAAKFGAQERSTRSVLRASVSRDGLAKHVATTV
jgi:hypothetical protein